MTEGAREHVPAMLPAPERLPDHPRSDATRELASEPAVSLEVQAEALSGVGSRPSSSEPTFSVDSELADPIRRAVAAFVAADGRMDPRSDAAVGCWEAALTAAGLPEALARIAELEDARTGALARISNLSRGWHDVCCTLRPGHDKTHRSVNQHGQPSRWVTVHATEEQAADRVATELSEVTARAEAAETQVANMLRAIGGIQGVLPNPEELRVFADLLDSNPELQGRIRKWAVACEVLAESKEQARA